MYWSWTRKLGPLSRDLDEPLILVENCLAGKRSAWVRDFFSRRKSDTAGRPTSRRHNLTNSNSLRPFLSGSCCFLSCDSLQIRLVWPSTSSCRNRSRSCPRRSSHCMILCAVGRKIRCDALVAHRRARNVVEGGQVGGFRVRAHLVFPFHPERRFGQNWD